jgi:predicted RecB family nuclease
MHVEREPGAGLEHREFLFTGPGDPRPAFVESLLEAAGDAGPVVVFGKVFEDTRLKELAETVPAHSEALQALRRRLWDLHPVVKQHTAHPDYRGSFSIKSVLPALVPGMSYKDMEVGRGDQVQPVWERLAAGEGTDAERARWRQSLLDYCRLDTLAMVRILEALREPARVRRAP